MRCFTVTRKSHNVALVLANSADPAKIPNYVVFHFDLPYLSSNRGLIDLNSLYKFT